MIYLVLRKRDGRFVCYKNGETLEFFEAEGKPSNVTWKDFASIILQNKYGFSEKTVAGIKVVEPLFTVEGEAFVYVQLGIVRLYSHLPFYSISYPFVQKKFPLHRIVKENFPDIKLNLEMLNLWL